MSKSLDNTIIPFDLVIDNSQIDMKNNIPLSMHIVCDAERKYELCIKDEDNTARCTFEVITKEGCTDILLPSEIIWSDLRLSQNYDKIFRLYWVKFEGKDHMNFVNRTYVPIDNGRITFNDNKIMPQSQRRLSPTMSDLPRDFILSHRYFVPTWKDFSGFNMDNLNYNAMSYQIRFLNEIQDKEQQVQSFGANEGEIETQRAIFNYDNIIPTSPTQQLVRKAFAASYTNVLFPNETDRKYVTTFSHKDNPQPTVTAQKRAGGCGCSRKRNA